MVLGDAGDDEIPFWFATYSRVPSGLTLTHCGPLTSERGMVASMDASLVRIFVTVPRDASVTYAKVGI